MAKKEKPGARSQKPEEEDEEEKKVSEEEMGKASSDVMRFKYEGHTINNFNWEGVSYRLFPGKEENLPVEAPQVKRMLAQGLLKKA